jgi:hypothetical protein
MSVFAQSWAWKFNIPSVPKLVLVALADQSDDDGEVRYRDISADFFSKKCGMSVRHFKRQIAALKTNGYVRCAIGGGRGNGTEYFLELGRPVTSLDEWHSREDEPEETMTDSTVETVTETMTETMTGSAVNYDKGGLTHNTNQFTKVTSARARARAKAHAPACSRETTEAAIAERLDFVCRESREWKALRQFDPEHVARAPIRYGVGNHANHTGWWFPRGKIMAALSFVAKSRGPPVSDSDAMAESTNRDGEHVSSATELLPADG